MFHARHCFLVTTPPCLVLPRFKSFSSIFPLVHARPCRWLSPIILCLALGVCGSSSPSSRQTTLCHPPSCMRRASERLRPRFRAGRARNLAIRSLHRAKWHILLCRTRRARATPSSVLRAKPRRPGAYSRRWLQPPTQNVRAVLETPFVVSPLYAPCLM